MDVSVILPCRNAAATLGAQLDALAGQDVDGDWEVIVVDHRSSDDSVDVAGTYRERLPSLRVLRAGRGDEGVAYVRNVGVRAARGDKLLFCDADDVVADGWIGALGRALDDYEIAAGRFDVARLNEPWVCEAYPYPQQDGLQDWDPPYLTHAGGGNLGLTRELYDRLGPFDEDPAIRYSEASDYCFRAQLAGFELGYVPEALIHVRMRHSLGAVFRQGRGWAACQVGLYRKYRPLGMPGAHWLRGLLAWLLVLPRLALVRDRGDLARWLFLLGWRVGRVQGSWRYRVLAF